MSFILKHLKKKKKIPLTFAKELLQARTDTCEALVSRVVPSWHYGCNVSKHVTHWCYPHSRLSHYKLWYLAPALQEWRRRRLPGYPFLV